MSEFHAQERARIHELIHDTGEALMQIERIEREYLDALRLGLREEQGRTLSVSQRVDLESFRHRVVDWKRTLLKRVISTVAFPLLIEERVEVMRKIDSLSLAGLEYDDGSNVERNTLIRREHGLTRLLELPFEVGEDVFVEGPEFRVFFLPNGDTLQGENHKGTVRFSYAQKDGSEGVY